MQAAPRTPSRLESPALVDMRRDGGRWGTNRPRRGGRERHSGSAMPTCAILRRAWRHRYNTETARCACWEGVARALDRCVPRTGPGGAHRSPSAFGVMSRPPTVRGPLSASGNAAVGGDAQRVQRSPLDGNRNSRRVRGQQPISRKRTSGASEPSLNRHPKCLTAPCLRRAGGQGSFSLTHRGGERRRLRHVQHTGLLGASSGLGAELPSFSRSAPTMN